jgi:hypothetical protein
MREMADDLTMASGGGAPDRAAGETRRPREDEERGKRATFDPDSGEVHGSGSGAGGGGNPGEDYDGDPMGGGGEEPAGAPRPASDGDRRPIDPDEGV